MKFFSNESVKTIIDGFTWAKCFSKSAINQGFVIFNGVRIAFEEALTKFVLFLRGWKKQVLRAVLALVVLFLLRFLLVFFDNPAPALVIITSILPIPLIAWIFLLVTPVYLVFRNLKRHWPQFETMSSDLHDYYIIFIKTTSLVIIVSLLAVILPFWWKTYPLIGFVLLLSLIIPLVNRGNIKINSALIIMVATLLFLQWTFPTTVTNWGTKLSGITGIKSSPARKEITSKYDSVVWFGSGEEGDCLVWYSGNELTGYRLWESPGFDPDTRQKLLPVCSVELKDSIIRDLKQKESTLTAIEQQATQIRHEKERASHLRAETASHERLRSEILNRSTPTNDPESTEVALLLWGQDDLSIDSIQNSLDLDQEAFSIQLRLFRKEFVSQGYADKLFKEPDDIIRRFDLHEFVDFVCLGFLELSMTKDAQAQGLISARGSLTLKTYSTTNQHLVYTKTIDGMGGGFSSEVAVSALLEELTESLDHYIKGLEFAQK